MRTPAPLSLCLLAAALLLSGCEEPTPPVPPGGVAQVEQQPSGQAPTPPTPPIIESFEGQPQLSLFPRVGDYQPEDDDERHPYWRTFIEHFGKVSGLQAAKETANRAWSYRSINTIDSVAYFSPLAVEPNARYRVSFRIGAQLPEGASAGLGILEYDEFLWVGEQFTEELAREHQLGAQEGVRLSGTIDFAETQLVEFSSGPRTQMVHLIFFREGAHDRAAVLLDDIAIEKVDGGNGATQ